MKLSDLTGVDPAYWISGTTYAQGKISRSQVDHQRYVRIAAGAGTTDPANDTTNWRPDGGRAIKSIQRGVITISAGTVSATATITAVVTAKTELRHAGGSGFIEGNGGTTVPRIALTNSTTITANSNGPTSTNVSWELTEFY